jgi:hypothetical protein
VFNQGSLVDEPYRKFLELSVKLGIYKRWFPHYLQLKLSCHIENVWKPLLWITNAFIYFGGKMLLFIKDYDYNESIYNFSMQCFFYWRIFAKIRPEKCDFDQYKGFFMRKMVQIRQISKIKKI